MKTDYHVHTEYSDDSVYPMRDLIEDAIDLGLDEICLTDHVDYGIKHDWDEGVEIEYRENGEPLANADYPRLYEEYLRLSEEYRDRIKVRFGLEFGMQRHTIPKFEELFARYPFDFILLSVHQVDDIEFWTGEFQKRYSQKGYNEKYYEELLYLTKHYKDYSVLAHLDLITRYDPLGPYPFEDLKPIVTEILKQVIRDGKGIEINSSNHRYGLSDMTPSREILRLYHDLGGRILSFGSDSHMKEHLFAYMPETMAEAKKLGFTEFCTFEKMEPIFHPL